MVSFSLCMIVRDEEDVLGRCLDSIRDIVDEVIIVDTGSRDQTKELAKKYTEKVYDYEWVHDFAAARNFSFSKATSDYIMWLDADDVIEERDRVLLKKLKKELRSEVDVVMMKYHAAFDSAGNLSMTYDRERIVRNRADYRWAGAVHEAITPRGVILYSDAAVTHRKTRVSDPDRNLNIYEKMVGEGRPLEPRHQFYFARELLTHGRYQEAEKLFLAFLDSEDGWAENKISACLDLASCLEKQNRKDEALLSLYRSFLFDKPRAEICCAAGALLMQKNKYEQAVYWFETALNLEEPERTGGFTYPDCRGFIPCLQLCVCLDRMGDHEKAEEWNKRAGALKPSDPAVLYNEKYFEGLGKKRPENAR